MERFGKVGHYYYEVTRGKDDRPVNPDRLRQSIGVEQSFVEDLPSLEAMGIELEKLAHTIKLRLDQHQQVGQTLTLKIKYSDYQQITRSLTVSKGL
ncbi:MAG: hypothetical protein HC934_06375 [Acaryochloridaceae cyanobacterium SU_2_1]|nr:hypothetical protein [Acaryochloridaceae cyanobacterium SU_2_1]